jgi:hypothetical protein
LGLSSSFKAIPSISTNQPGRHTGPFTIILGKLGGNIEDNTFVEMPNGEKLSITQIYALQAEEEQKAQAQQEQPKGE